MSEYIYKGKVPTAFIDEALEAYRMYKADRDPFIQRIRDNEAFYRRSYQISWRFVLHVPTKYGFSLL